MDDLRLFMMFPPRLRESDMLADRPSIQELPYYATVADTMKPFSRT